MCDSDVDHVSNITMCECYTSLNWSVFVCVPKVADHLPVSTLNGAIRLCTSNAHLCWSFLHIVLTCDHNIECDDVFICEWACSTDEHIDAHVAMVCGDIMICSSV